MLWYTRFVKGFPPTLAIVDVETTGMRPSTARLTDIGIIRVENGRVTERFESLINPGQMIPPSITGITGITNDMVAGAPSFEDIAHEVTRLLTGAVFVAHNAGFDYSFISAEFARCGMSFSAPLLCSMQLSRRLFPKERRHNLDAVIARCSLVCTGRHRAMPDAEAIVQYFEYVSREFQTEIVSRAVSLLQGGEINVRGYADLPEGPGVYLFYGKEGELLYIGKSRNVRARVRSHFCGSSPKERRLQSETTAIDAIPLSGELSALLLEASLIKKEMPLLNRMLRKRRMLVHARAVLDDAGYLTLHLARDAEEGSLSFTSMRQAKDVLRTLANEHRVCAKLMGVESGPGPCFGTQLDVCDGACVGRIHPDVHNARLTPLLEHASHAWPFSGPVVIREEGRHGTLIAVDAWRVVGAFRDQGEGLELFPEISGLADRDTQHILARYFQDHRHMRLINVLPRKEFDAVVAACTNSYEPAIN